MKNLFTLLAIFALSIAAIAQTGAKTAHSGDLVALLPASDVAATMNLKRFLDEALPQILASKPAELTKINNSIAEFKAKTGIDLRTFEEVAVGIDLSNITFNNMPDAQDGVVLLRGTFNPIALVAAGKIAAKDKFKVEKIGDRTVTIFAVGEIAKDAAKNKPTAKPANDDKIAKFFDNLLRGDVAVTAIDGGTVAFGKPQSVRSLLTNQNNRVASNMQSVFQRKSTAILNFAASVPAKSLPQTGEEFIDAAVSAISVMSGSVDVRDGDALLLLSAQTTKPDELEELFALGQSFGSGFIKDKVLARFLKSLTISKASGEVSLEGTLTASDITELIDKGTQKPAATTK